MPDNLAVIILTFNSSGVIERTLSAARRVSKTIICVDSGSTDATVEILCRFHCEVHNRPFKHYADQRNWAITTLGNQYAWQLHLDADEILDADAIEAIQAAVADSQGYAGFLLHRRQYFLGRELRFGGASNWHLRLFQSGACEDRLYDQHFLCSGPTKKLPGWMHDTNNGNLAEWTTRHNRWSDLESRELLRSEHDPAGILQPRLTGDPRQRRRAYKGIYYRAPRFLRAWLYFIFRYVVQLGFLDGRVGFLYALFQALWFRMLVDAKLYEAAAIDRRQSGEDARTFAPAPVSSPERQLR
jgi:glycosyltransferase involved in cell wall biosynthesis